MGRRWRAQTWVERKLRERGARSAASAFLRWRRGEAGRGSGGEGCHTAARGGGGPQPYQWAVGSWHQPDRSALTRAARAGAQSISTQGRAGSLSGGPRTTMQGGAAESQSLTHGLHSTVRVAVELDLKKKFQIRLKSNGSNGFKSHQTLSI
jgi:hypothetical protein